MSSSNNSNITKGNKNIETIVNDNTILNTQILDNKISDDKTVLNKKSINDDSTVINDQALSSNITESEFQKETLSQLEINSVLNAKYIVKDRLDVKSGESELYLVLYENEYFVAKRYSKNHSISPEVIEKLKTITCPYVSKYVDSFVDESNCFIEIVPYYSKKSLKGRKCSYEELKNIIIPNLNEGIKALNDAGIIHKDLKPSNIMWNDDMSSVIIIDFGISSVSEDGSIVVSKIGKTPIYSAPEALYEQFIPYLSDYYSLGMTIYELFNGKLPFADNTTIDDFIRFRSTHHLPFTDDTPTDLRHLILGLTYADVRNMNDKNHPENRWSYEQVCKWLRGEVQVVPGQGILTDSDMLPYYFLGKQITSISDLIDELGRNWEKGCRELFSSALSNFFRNSYYGYYEISENAIAKTEAEDFNKDIAFFEWIYQMQSRTSKIYWKGHVFESITDIAIKLKDLLDKKASDSNFDIYDDMLRNRVLSSFLRLSKLENEELKKLINDIENTFIIDSNLKDKNTKEQKERKKTLAYYMLVYTLSTDKTLVIGEEKFKNLDEFFEYVTKLSTGPFKKLEDFCRKLISVDGKLNITFESWLYALGKKQEVLEWTGKR